jgi:lysozyme
MQTSSTLAIELIKQFESLHDGNLKKIGLQPKADPIGIYTEGYGRAMINPATKGFLTTKTATQDLAESLATIDTVEEATAALAMDMKPRERTLIGMLGGAYAEKLNANQVGAATSFVYNCGVGKPKPYQIFGKIQQWLDKKITDADLRAYWDASVTKGGGKVLPGLVRRRKSEVHLFLTGELKTKW